ncbi:hypothetical protein M3J09_003929 [Ascochyta lentis]
MAMERAATCWHVETIDIFLTQVARFPDAKREENTDALTRSLLSILANPDCLDRCREIRGNIRTSARPIMEQLVAAGARTNHESFMASILCSLVRRETVQFLLDHALNVRRTAEDGGPLLFDIVGDTNSDTSMLEALLATSASATTTDTYHNTPLHVASHTSFAEVLLRRSADVHAKDKQGQTPLHTACKRSNVELARWLTAQGSDADEVTTVASWPPLLIAAGEEPVFTISIRSPASQLWNYLCTMALMSKLQDTNA